jgi:hydroxyacylglutathione hydrolase
MLVEIFPSGPLDTNAILLACEQTKKAMVIDPAYHSEKKILKKAEKENLQIEKIYLTHSHWDHIADLAPLVKILQCPVFVHKEDAENVKNPGSDQLPLFISINGVDNLEFLEEGQMHHLGKLSFTIITTPGHSPGGVCLYFNKEKILISGDTLFKGSFGNISFPGCDAEKMFLSLKKLAKLPKDTTVIPGHGAKTTIGQEPWMDQAKQHFGY